MDFQCPRCGVALEITNNAIHTRCPDCGASFRTDEISAFTHHQQDDVIDVHAEVVSSEYDGPYVEASVESAQEQETYANNRVFFDRNITFERRESCGCSGCGCLTVLLLLLFLLFRL